MTSRSCSGGDDTCYGSGSREAYLLAEECLYGESFWSRYYIVAAD